MDLSSYGKGHSAVVSIIVATALVTSVACVTSIWRPWRSKDRSTSSMDLKEVPTAKYSLPYFGHLFSFPNDEIPAVTIIKWQKEIGPIMRVNMGVQPWVFISDAQLAHQFLNVCGAKTAKRPDHTYWKEYQSRGHGAAFNNPNARWKNVHTVVAKFFSPDYVNANLETPLGHEVDATVSELLSTTAREGQVDIFAPLQFSTLNIALISIFGRRATSVHDPLFTTLIDLLERGVYYVNPLGDTRTLLPHFSWIIDYVTQTKKAMADFSFKERDPFYYELVDEALKSDRHCFANAMNDVKDGVEVTDKTVMIACHDMVVSVTDPTATSTAWAVALLCAHPEEQRRLQCEIDAYLDKHDQQLPTFADHAEFPLLMSAIKESLRLRSISSFTLPHEATADLTFNGYTIPKGTVIAPNIDAMHEDPAWYHDPEDFVIDRFLGNPALTSKLLNAPPKDRDHYAFGFGRRTCPGAYLGELMMFHILVRLLTRTHIEPVSDNAGNPLYPSIHERKDGGGVLLPKQSCMRFIPRERHTTPNQ